MTERTLERTFECVFSSPFVGDHLTLLWHAGEPLVVGVDYYRRAFELLERHRPMGVTVTCHFQTNGTLLTQDWVDFFRSADAKVGLSLDGPSDLHDRSRKTRAGKGTFEQAMRGLRVLQDNNFPFHVITVLTKRSLASSARLFEFYVENGITQVAFNIEEIEGEHEESSLSSGDVDQEMRAFLRQFLELAARHRPRLSVREFDGALHAIVNPACSNYGNPMAEPLRFVSVGVHGDLSTFSPELIESSTREYPSFIFGNVHENELADILVDPAFVRVNADIERGIESCRASCGYFDICRGGVPSNKLFENGNFASCETLFCRLSKKAVIDVVLEKIESELGISWNSEEPTT